MSEDFFAGVPDAEVLAHPYFQYLRDAMQAASRSDTVASSPAPTSSSVVEAVVNAAIIDPLLVPQASGPNTLMQQVLPMARDVARRRARLAKMALFLEVAKEKIFYRSASTKLAEVGEEVAEGGTTTPSSGAEAELIEAAPTPSLTVQMYLKDIDDFMTRETAALDAEANSVLEIYRRHVQHLRAILPQED